MSGGVDSTCVALMLRKHYNVTGFFMQLGQPDLGYQLKRVRGVADKLQIPLRIIDLQNQFESKVIQYFCDSYMEGKTPNPCMVCNRQIKFGQFMDHILNHDIDKVATGHYANISMDKGIYSLHKGKDQKKDQSYFLAKLGQQQLSRVLFPLGNMRKDEIYDIAETNGFTDFRGQESQDICFLSNTRVPDFISQQTTPPPPKGDIVTSDGTILGVHRGLSHYTIGQRRGLGICHSSPYYVVALDSLNNRVVVGKESDLYCDTAVLTNIHWTNTPAEFDKKYRVKIRYSHHGAAVKFNDTPPSEIYALDLPHALPIYEK